MINGDDDWRSPDTFWPDFLWSRARLSCSQYWALCRTVLYYYPAVCNAPEAVFGKISHQGLVGESPWYRVPESILRTCGHRHRLTRTLSDKRYSQSSILAAHPVAFKANDKDFGQPLELGLPEGDKSRESLALRTEARLVERFKSPTSSPRELLYLEDGPTTTSAQLDAVLKAATVYGLPGTIPHGIGQGI